MRAYSQLVRAFLAVGLLTTLGCSRGYKTPTNLFDGVWTGWMSQPEAGVLAPLITFNSDRKIAWIIWKDKGVFVVTTISDAHGIDHSLCSKLKFRVGLETTGAGGKKELTLETSHGQYRIVFAKDGNGFEVYDATGRQFGGFSYVGNSHDEQPEEYHAGF